MRQLHGALTRVLAHASLMARLMTKPVEIAPGQSPDPTYALLTGTADLAAWTESHRLLTKVVQLREPGCSRGMYIPILTVRARS